MKTKKDLIGLWCIAGVLLMVGAFADLSISHAIYDPASGFGNLFEAIGEFPAMFIASFCTMAIAVVQKRRHSGKFSVKGLVSFLFSILFALAAGMMPVSYLGVSKAVGLILGIAVFAADLFMVKAIAQHHEKELYRAAVFGLQLFLLVLLLFNLVKMGWGRERYRHMDAIGDFAGFSAWFLPQGFTMDNEFMSFPSGHSANAAISMCLVLLPTFLPSLKKKETLLKGISILWIVCVMVSRIIMGAHFLSDVTMGAALSLTVFFLLYQKHYIKKAL